MQSQLGKHRSKTETEQQIEKQLKKHNHKNKNMTAKRKFIYLLLKSKLYTCLVMNSTFLLCFSFCGCVFPFNCSVFFFSQLFLFSFSVCYSAASNVVSTDLSEKMTIRLSFCSFPDHEKDKRTWQQLIKYIR